MMEPRHAGDIECLATANLGVSFGERVVFQGLTTFFPAGYVTALTGPSGSGKSTLLAALAGYLPATEGTIGVVDGSGLWHKPSPQAVAWVPQGANALSRRTAADNVAIAAYAAGRGLADSRRVVRRELGRVGLADRSGDLARSLSGGELQRLAFARALAAGRPIVFADEPTASLDERNTRQIAELLSSLRAGGIVVVATHDPLLIAAAGWRVDLRSCDG